MELFVYFLPQNICKFSKLIPFFFSRSFHVTLKKKHSLKLSKYKLWKTLHELGFRYAKINGNKKALVERKDLVNKRINFLRTIKQKI
jgi:hypothetical protein